MPYFGCGCDLSARPTDRLALLSPSSNKVVAQWRVLMMENSFNDSELDSLLHGIVEIVMIQGKCAGSVLELIRVQ